MGFDSDEAAVYQIRFQHRSDEVLEIIPADFSGVLVSDRGKSYDAAVFADMKQQKCLGHLLRNISEALEDKTGPTRQFGLRLKGMLQQALELGFQSVESGPFVRSSFHAKDSFEALQEMLCKKQTV